MRPFEIKVSHWHLKGFTGAHFNWFIKPSKIEVRNKGVQCIHIWVHDWTHRRILLIFQSFETPDPTILISMSTGAYVSVKCVRQSHAATDRSEILLRLRFISFHLDTYSGFGSLKNIDIFRFSPFGSDASKKEMKIFYINPKS